MDDTGTVLGAHVVGEQGHALDVVEDGLTIVQVVERLGRHLVGLAVDHDRRALPAGNVAHLGCELLEHDLGAAVDHDGHVVRLGVQDDGVVGGKGPRGRGPDVNPEVVLVGLEAGGHGGLPHQAPV